MELSKIYRTLISPFNSILSDKWNMYDLAYMRLEEVMKNIPVRDYSVQWKSDIEVDIERWPDSPFLSRENVDELKGNYKSICRQMMMEYEQEEREHTKAVSLVCSFCTEDEREWIIDRPYFYQALRDKKLDVTLSWMSRPGVIFFSSMVGRSQMSAVTIVSKLLKENSKAVACLAFKSTEAEAFKKTLLESDDISTYLASINYVRGWVYVVYRHRTGYNSDRVILKYYLNGQLVFYHRLMKMAATYKHLFDRTPRKIVDFVHPRIVDLLGRNTEPNDLYFRVGDEEYKEYKEYKEYVYVPPQSAYSYLSDTGTYEFVDVPKNDSGRFLGRAVYPPAVIVDLTEMHAFHLKKVRKDRMKPFLLSDSQVAFELLRPCFHGRKKIASQDYMYLAKRMNSVLGKEVYALEHDKRMSLPGKPYRMSQREKEWVIDCLWKRMEGRASRKRSVSGTTSDTEWIEPYCDNMVKHGFLTKGADGYVATEKFSRKSDQALFALLVSAVADNWKVRYPDKSKEIISLSHTKGSQPFLLKGRIDARAFESAILGIEQGTIRNNKKNAIYWFEYGNDASKNKGMHVGRIPCKQENPEAIQNIPEIIKAVRGVKCR